MDEKNAVLWETVARAAGMTEANLIAGRLTSEGIETQLRYDAAGAIYGITINGLGEVRIQVPVPEWERAREILARAYDDSEIPWEATREESPLTP